MTYYLKLLSVIILLLFSTSNTEAQTPGNWVWVHGSNSINNSGVYGTKGAPSPANMPTAAYEACSWTDLSGNFWLFGGAFGTDATNAMWKFDPVVKQWAWMHGPATANGLGIYGTKGIPSVNNIPGARGWGVSTWTDLQGNFWLFGGFGYDITGFYNTLNDLWKFNPVTLEWTWMSGSNTGGSPGVYGTMGIPNSANEPPAIVENHLCWTDSGDNLWLYGGQAAGFGSTDDLWKYSIATSQWTWISGSGGSTTNPVYGPLGVESSSYSPGSRYGYTSFTDPNGYLFLFGAENFLGSSNDVWRYNPTNNKWAYWGGTNLAYDAGSYINKCDDNTVNYPEAALEMRATWPDSCGFWVFGGFTFGGQSLNNLWYFNADNKKFTWAKGSNIPDDAGTYGTQNLSSTTNDPPARNGAVTWNDKNGNLWMFGGELDFGLSACYNDLWMYTPDPACIPLCGKSIFNNTLNANFTTDETNCNSLTVYFKASYNSGTTYNWNFGDGTGTTSPIKNPFYTYSNPGTYLVTLIVSDATGAKDTLQKSILVVYNQCETLFIPNVFSPDGNGNNDLFTVTAEGFKNYEIEIYDRWGLKVFKSDDNHLHWNGKKMNTGTSCPDGTYYYIINVTNQKNELQKHAGFLTLLRK
jgi:gliding motility-associated-like protein